MSHKGFVESTSQKLPDGSIALLKRIYNLSGSETWDYSEKNKSGPGWLPPKNVADYVGNEFDAFLEFIEQGAGRGSYRYKLINFMTGFDRYGQMGVPPNNIHAGLTFFTRPRLCLTSQNLRHDPMFAPLDTFSSGSLAFAIRCLLDSKLSRNKDYAQEINNAEYFDVNNAFFVPLTAACTSITGFPDPYLDTQTTKKGYFGEDQTTAVGSNRLQGTYDLSLSFQDTTYSPIIYMFLYWLAWTDHYCRGTMSAYKIDNMNIRVPYTISIYRFTLDPSRTYIIHHAKATGCFPKTVPLGDMLNVNEGETFTSASSKFTIPFTTNNVRYDDPRNIISFNRLAERYAEDLHKKPSFSQSGFSNFNGIPYIESTPQGFKLVFKDYRS